MKSKKVWKKINWTWVLILGVLTGLSSCFLFSSSGDDEVLSKSMITELDPSFLITHKILRNEGSTSNS
ncbi:MAG: hypothetical protein N2442_00340, partial [Spirochaetes bacterium]|nr:hypothetical protein [Spirochaetota bacterium]